MALSRKAGTMGTVADLCFDQNNIGLGVKADAESSKTTLITGMAY